MKMSIVYWTGTGNTQIMAETIMDTLEDLGFDPQFDFVGDADLEESKNSEWIFLGSPAMTGEDIEEIEFRPFYEALKESMENKNVVLFGSFDWGGGEWIETWAEEVESLGGLVQAKIKTQWNPEEEQLNEIDKTIRSLFE